MRKRNKYVPAFFQVYENDSLKEYLEFMAQSGWRLKSVGSMFLRFEECEPRRIRYCVEVMEKPSAYASNQTEKLKAYREFCRDAGWDYAGTTGYLHIFYTEDEGAVLVETDLQERYERICQACQGNMRMFLVLFGLIAAMNLYSCYLRKTLLCLNGLSATVMTGALAWGLGEFHLWKGRARRSLKESGTLPCVSWRAVRRKNQGAVALALILCMAPLVYAVGHGSSWALMGVIGGLWVYTCLLMFIYTKLLYWIREKRAYSRGANMVIYWGIGLAAGAVLCTVFLALIFRMM